MSSSSQNVTEAAREVAKGVTSQTDNLLSIIIIMYAKIVSERENDCGKN
jgi:hypothetical protein